MFEHNENVNENVNEKVNEMANEMTTDQNETEHYDGASLREAFGSVYRPEGNKAHFIETREYLQQVRDCKRRVGLMEDRIHYREEAGMDTSNLESELAEITEILAFLIAEVAEEISKLRNVNLEMVMVKRYIDVLSWDDVAKSLDIKMRTVQKFHGRALPRMQRILVEDGLVQLELLEPEEDSEDSEDNGEDTEDTEDSEDSEDSSDTDGEEPDEFFND